MRRKTVDLTKVDGCYSKELREACPTIKFMLKEPQVSLTDMKNVVHIIISEATINAKAKERFTKNLFACESKEAVDKLCSDAVIHGRYYHSKTQAC